MVGSERLNMAEGTQTEAPPRLYVANASMAVTETRSIEPARPPEDPFRITNVELLRRLQDAPEGSFRRAEIMYEHFNSIPINSLPQPLQVELQNRRDAIKAEFQNFVREADQDSIHILEGVRKEALDFYKRVKSAKLRSERGEPDRQAVINSGRGRAYNEVFWNDSPQLKQLQAKYRGLAEYMWEGIVAEIYKEANGIEELALNPLAESEFRKIHEQRRSERKREKRYITRETPYGVYYELTAENANELPAAVLDFTKDRIFALSDTDLEGIDGEVRKIREEAVRLLEQNRVRLNEEAVALDIEAQYISESDPNFLRAKASAEAIPDVLGNEKMLFKGGEEYAPRFKERFAANFIGHDDAIYLENPKAALIMYLLTTVKDGTYWMGHDWDVEKVDDEGQITDYRREIEEEIVEYAATHELFLSDEMTRDLFGGIGAFEYRNGGNPDKRDLRYSFDDNIEKLLLDPDGSVWANTENRLRERGESQDKIDEGRERHNIRVGVFKRIKERLDAQEHLAGLTPEQRQEAIRQRIIQKMGEKSHMSYLAKLTERAQNELTAATAQEGPRGPLHDRIIWQWVKDYNNYRIKLRLQRWYPSGWDRVRQHIDRPTKVLDRVLSDEELEAMFELNPLQLKQPEELNREERYEVDSKLDEARFGFMLARSYQVFHMQDTLLGGIRTRLIDPNTGKYTGRLPDDEISKLLGLIDENGQVIDPNRKVVRVFDVVQARLKAAIDKEAALINQAKVEKAAAIASGDQDLIKQKTEALRVIMDNAKFLATHVLKELGLVEGKLPVWSYNFIDQTTINTFTQALAAYGVEVAPGVPITHNNKEKFYEIIESGRRALRAEYDRATQEFFDGRYPVFDEQGKFIRMERFRVVSKGAVKENRNKTEARFEISTSGGVALPELISTIGDLGFYPLLVWLGVTDIKGLHGYIKRRDEVESHRHKFFDVMDPIHHARAEKGAIIARKFLVGGNIEGKGDVPGLLNEPFSASFKIRDFLLDINNWEDKTVPALNPQELKPEHYKKLTLKAQDALVELAAERLKYLIAYMDARRYVENRLKRATRAWEYDNTLILYAWSKAARASMKDPNSMWGDKNLDYSGMARSEMMLAYYKGLLSSSTYHILFDREREVLARRGIEPFATEENAA